MSRAPSAAGLLFGLAVAVIVLLLGPLTLFNPWFTSALQQRHDVAAEFDTSQSEIDRVTGEVLLDVYTDGAFDASLDGEEPLLDERERSHMHDVAVLVRILAGVLLLAFVLAFVTGAMLRGEARRMGRILLVSGGLVGTVALLLAGTFAAAFEPAFLFFHELFFPPGTYLFEAGSELILLFPERFWFDAALVAGATIILSALVVTLAGLRLWRRSPPATPLAA